MKKSLRVELPAVHEVWKEVSLMAPNPIFKQAGSWPPRRERVEKLALLLKQIGSLVSMEEVFGPDLLKRFEASRTRADASDRLLQELSRGRSG